MIIENDNGRFWLDDSLDVDTMTGAEMKQALIPYKVYEKQIQIKELKQEIADFDVPTDEELIKLGKEHSPEWEDYQNLVNELEELEN